MGGGGLRILPHKSWHVWNFENRERVRKDEEQARREEEELRERAEAAVLRKRKDERRSEEGDAYQMDGDRIAVAFDGEGEDVEGDEVLPQELPTEHINFFKHLEDGKTKQGHNKDHAAEKKKALEAEQKKIGALVFLGQSVADAKGVEPWYAQTSVAPLPGGQLSRSQARMERLDPMAAVKAAKAKDEDAERDKKDHRRLRHCRTAPYHIQHDSHSDGDSAMSAMRAQRLRREQEEREKVARLLARSAVAETPPATPLHSFHSQYNPTLTRALHAAPAHPRPRSRSPVRRDDGFRVPARRDRDDRDRDQRSDRRDRDGDHADRAGEIDVRGARDRDGDRGRHASGGAAAGDSRRHDRDAEWTRASPSPERHRRDGRDGRDGRRHGGHGHRRDSRHE